MQQQLRGGTPLVVERQLQADLQKQKGRRPRRHPANPMPAQCAIHSVANLN